MHCSYQSVFRTPNESNPPSDDWALRLVEMLGSLSPARTTCVDGLEMPRLGAATVLGAGLSACRELATVRDPEGR
eukprot:COSAG02_NODE_2083_length_9893_cov_3.131815_9_plen_75_part_00